MTLEKMGDFFDSRLSEYEEHQLDCIESAKIFYRFTASLLPMTHDCRVIDLGCGTGLELDEYFAVNPFADVTGIDLASGMLEALRKKHAERQLTLINGSYFDEELGDGVFNAAVSVESLHHFTSEQKLPLYKKLHRSLNENGYFILTDYFAQSDAHERECFQKLAAIKRELSIDDNELYHFDTPLTSEHETEALLEAGFKSVELLGQWGATKTLKAVR